MMTYLKTPLCEVAKVLGNQHYTKTYSFSEVFLFAAMRL